MLPALAGGLVLGLVFLLGLRNGWPGLIVRGGVVVMAVLLGYGAWLINGWTEKSEDFRTVAAALRRHARSLIHGGQAWPLTSIAASYRT